MQIARIRKPQTSSTFTKSPLCAEPGAVKQKDAGETAKQKQDIPEEHSNPEGLPEVTTL